MEAPSERDEKAAMVRNTQTKDESPPSLSPRFSIVLLFFDEEANVVGVLTSLRDALERAGEDFELVAVNNGSRDRTASLLREIAGGGGRIRLVEIPENRGYGWGALQGLQSCRGEWIGFMAGDGQVDPGDVLRLLRQAGSSWDLVKVRRAVREDGFIRQAISDVYVMLFCLTFNLPFYDINATPRLFRRRWLEVLDLRSRDWFLDAEILLKAGYLGFRVKEVPIVFKRRGGGSSSVNFKTVVEFIINIIRFRFGPELRKWKRTTRSKL